MADVAAIVLAAGRATRFGAGPDDSKVFARLDGVPLVARVVATALRSRASRVVVVVGQAADRADPILAGQPITIVRNRDFGFGIATSIQTGIGALPEAVEGALILLADMPLVSSATLERLIATFERERPDAVVPCYRGEWGNPVVIGRPLFAQLLALSGDSGARGVLKQRGHGVVTCDIDDPHVLTDIDTLDALAQAAVDFGDPPG